MLAWLLGLTGQLGLTEAAPASALALATLGLEILD